MAAATYNILIEQGATFRFRLQWKDDEGNPIDLDGYSARMQVRPFVESDEVLLNLNTEDGGITIESDWEIVVEATAEQTQVIIDYAGAYDLELESADGTVYRLVQGKVKISPEVTR